MIVFKFGGKSLSSKEKMLNICKYIQQCLPKGKIIVVVSAMGNSTNNLLELANSYANNNIPLRELDVLLSTGETQSASLMAIMLNSMGMSAASMQGWQAEIKTMGKHGQSVIVGINKSSILQKLNNFDVVVVTGFQGVDNNGNVTTLGRGGSDTTAVALGAVFGCPVEIYSDFDGVFAGDPAHLNFKKFDNIDYDFMQDMSNNGAKVLSSSSVDMAKQANVNVVCKQSAYPQKSGTHISNVPFPCIALTTTDNLCEINVLYNGDKHFMQKTAKYVANNVKYHKFCAESNKITLLIDKTCKQSVILKIAEINHLLEDE